MQCQQLSVSANRAYQRLIAVRYGLFTGQLRRYERGAEAVNRLYDSCPKEKFSG